MKHTANGPPSRLRPNQTLVSQKKTTKRKLAVGEKVTNRLIQTTDVAPPPQNLKKTNTTHLNSGILNLQISFKEKQTKESEERRKVRDREALPNEQRQRLSRRLHGRGGNNFAVHKSLEKPSTSFRKRTLNERAVRIQVFSPSVGEGGGGV